MSIPRKARENALRMLFQWDMTREEPARVKQLYWEHSKMDPAAREMAERLFDAVVERMEEIDGLIGRHAEHWRPERMSTVDRNILRVAVCEFLTRPGVHSTIPISEALEVARRYSSNESAQFINGVLDAVRRTLNRPEPHTGE